ncbi:MAG: acyl-CoA thioesterase [Pseudomonadota bacterium]
MLPYHREITVEWGESDPFGLVYFPCILAWFNDAEHAFFAEAGYPVKQMVEQDRTAFVMGRVNFEFTGPAAYGERVLTELGLADITTSTVTWSCIAKKPDSDTLVAKGTATRVYAQIQADGGLKAIPIPENIRGLLGQS